MQETIREAIQKTDGQESQLYRMKYSSPVGVLTLTSNQEALVSLEFEQERYPFVVSGDFQVTEVSSDAQTGQRTCQKAAIPLPLLQAIDWLDCYFSGQRPDFLPPISPEGSSFRRRVWRELLNIPYGATVTYGSIAKKLALEDGRPHMSAQAVGGAVGHNPIGIIIPCHRVVGSDGSLTGFGGGIETKKALLTLEGIQY